MTTSATEDLARPSLRPRHDGALHVEDLVAGLWIEWFDATPVEGSSPPVRPYGRHYVVRPPHWTNHGYLVVDLLQRPDHKTDHEITAGAFTLQEVRPTSLSALGMVPEANGPWRDNWVIRSADQHSRKPA